MNLLVNLQKLSWLAGSKILEADLMLQNLWKKKKLKGQKGNLKLVSGNNNFDLDRNLVNINNTNNILTLVLTKAV